jgi:hypothetical protein
MSRKGADAVPPVRDRVDAGVIAIAGRGDFLEGPDVILDDRELWHPEAGDVLTNHVRQEGARIPQVPADGISIETLKRDVLHPVACNLVPAVRDSLDEVRLLSSDEPEHEKGPLRALRVESI